MLLDPMTTWSLVRISPVELMIMPVPAALPLPRVVLTLTMAGLTLAATASVVASVLFDEPGLGVTCLIGDWVGGAVACATGCEPLTARARLQPMPAPPAAATTAMSTRKAATRFHIESAGAVGGGGRRWRRPRGRRRRGVVRRWKQALVGRGQRPLLRPSRVLF